MNKIKQWFINHPKITVELKSAFVTFSAIFLGSIILTPAFNSLVGSNLPTMNQLSDLLNVAIDTLYRSLWITFLTETGLYKYRKSN